MEYIEKYILTQNQLLLYSKLDRDCPVTIAAAAKVALEKLREHLDDIGIRMPRPKWLYNHFDERTWKYLPTDVNAGYYRMYVDNPKFMYRAK